MEVEGAVAKATGAVAVVRALQAHKQHHSTCTVSWLIYTSCRWIATHTCYMYSHCTALAR
jgi:hypothetical protein